MIIVTTVLVNEIFGQDTMIYYFKVAFGIKHLIRDGLFEKIIPAGSITLSSILSPSVMRSSS